MSRDSYRHAVVRLRDALDLLGPYRRECLLCGRSPDARHRQADAITGALLAGDPPGAVAADYLPDDTPGACELVLTVALAILAADPRLHGLTRVRASEVEWQAYADLTNETTHPTTEGTH